VASNAPSATYWQSVTVHGLFPITAGYQPFNLIGRKNNSGAASNSPVNVNLSLVFVPTAYGVTESP